MKALKEEIIAKIKYEIGVNNIQVMPMFKGWAICYKIGDNPVQALFPANSKEECEEIVRLATN